MAIGNFGKLITFETNDKRILSPLNIKHEVSGRWASHSRIGKKPLRQFLGPDVEKTTFTIKLDARHGVRPRKTLDAIEKHVRNGIPESLVIGGKKVGGNRMTINSISETWDEVWNGGELIRASADLTLEEYPE